MTNRVIRVPYYEKDHDEGVRFADPERGLQWGADAVPALLGLFRVERDARDDHPDGEYGRDWLEWLLADLADDGLVEVEPSTDETVARLRR